MFCGSWALLRFSVLCLAIVSFRNSAGRPIQREGTFVWSDFFDRMDLALTREFFVRRLSLSRFPSF